MERGMVMRLIDADRLKAYIDAQNGRPFIGCTVGEALKIMADEQPTVDAIPVVHGQWVTDGMMMDCGEYLMTRCTACGTPFEYGYDMPYCPQCGAKMDGKDGEQNG